MDSVHELEIEDLEEDDIEIKKFSSNFSKRKRSDAISFLRQREEPNERNTTTILPAARQQREQVNEDENKAPQRIPGPAGLHQLQKDNKLTCVRNGPSNKNAGVMSRRNFIDPDFLKPSWLNLKNYIESEVGITSVKVALSNPTPRKLQKLGLMATDFICNGNGSTFVTFKDETGSIGGAVHNNVFEKFSSFVPFCSVVLTNVTILPDTPYFLFLCIVQENIVKVFEAEEGDDEYIDYFVREKIKNDSSYETNKMSVCNKMEASDSKSESNDDDDDIRVTQDIPSFIQEVRDYENLFFEE